MRVLITGSQGPLGRALSSRFTSLGYDVIGVDLPGTGAMFGVDLEGPLKEWHRALSSPVSIGYDVLIANAKLRTWESHQYLATFATSAIVNIGSIYGVVGNDPTMYEGTEIDPTPSWYAASKGALVGLTKWQATNLAPVRSNCICPGGIGRGHSDTFAHRYISKVPLRRMATETDVVNAVEFLASDRASYITGQVLMVDGGLTACA